MTAQMAAMMGAETTMVGCLGQDSIAGDTLKHMQDLGIRTEWIASTSEAASGVASIMTSTADGQNVIVVVPGANLKCASREFLCSGSPS
jgi:ribokinase